MTLVGLQNVALSYGGPPLIANVSFAIGEGERVFLLGRNGAGKSSLLRAITGEMEPSVGIVTRRNGLRITELSQRLPDDLDDSAIGVSEVVASGFPGFGARLAEYHHRLHTLSASPTMFELNEIDRLHGEIEREGGFSKEPQIERALDAVGVERDAEWDSLSVGRKRRVLLARAIVSRPDLLILDEPTNHLDVATIEWLEEFLREYEGSILVVTHDRAFLRRLATRVLLVDRGEVRDYPGDYASYLRRREEDDDARKNSERVADRALDREEAWAKQGVKAQRCRAEARLSALAKMRDERRARRAAVGRVKTDIANGVRSGDLVIDVKDLCYSWSPQTAPLFRDFTTDIRRGDKIGVMGPNGSGKTTLLRVLLGELAPTTGTLRHGAQLQIAYFDQLHAELDETKSVARNVSPDDFVVVGSGKRHIVSFLSDFLFKKEQIHRSVKDLSGGERNRLLLARLFTRPSNVLVLDEPTNDLDAETVDVLEELLIEYTGTVLLVSHDREFLNRVVTSTFVLEGDGVVGEYVGGYDDWVAQKKRQLVERAAASAETVKKAKDAKNAAVGKGARKRTYAENLEVAQLPARIESLEIEKTKLLATMSDPTFYSKPPAEVARATRRLDEVSTEIETIYARWLELESLA